VTKIFDEPTWAIVELFGHGITAGFIQEVTIAGTEFLRVDVPHIIGGNTKFAGVTKFYGGGAIYAITPSDEDSVRHALGHMETRPVSKWTIPDKPALTANVNREPRLVDPDGDGYPDEGPPYAEEIGIDF